MLLPAGQVFAATINVDSDCSLANAIRSANGDAQVSPLNSCETGAAGADTIALSSSVTLSALLPEITSHVNIRGVPGNYTFVELDSATQRTGPAIATAAGSNLILEHLTLRNGGGGDPLKAALHLGDSATLTNVSVVNSWPTAIIASGANAVFNFSDIYITYTFSTWSWPSAIWAKAGQLTITDLAIVNMPGGADMIRVDSGARMTLSGCQSHNRVMNNIITRNGSVTDNSSETCASPRGNNSAFVIPLAKAPGARACGFPDYADTVGSWVIVADDAGLLEYTLSGDCVLTATSGFFIPSNVRMVIKSPPGQRYTITVAPHTLWITLAGELTLRNVDIVTSLSDSPAQFVLRVSPPGNLIIEDSTIRRGSTSVGRYAIRIDGAKLTLTRVTIRDFHSTSNVIASAIWFVGPVDATITDSTFSGNTGGPGAISIYHNLGGAVRLLGTNTFTGNTPVDIHDPHGLCQGLGCPHYSPPPPPSREGAQEDDGEGIYIPPTPIPAARISPTQTCLDLVPGIVVSNLSGGASCRLVSGSGIGHADVIAANPSLVVDLWGWVTPGTQVCFRADSGAIKFIDTTMLPRTVADLPVFSQPGGLLCATIDGAGQVALVAGPPAPAVPTATLDTQLLGDCMVRTQYILNFRASPGGESIDVVPYNVNLTALERSAGWYKVDYHGARGWISADFVEPEGNCG